jgi:hypothetical protein
MSKSLTDCSDIAHHVTWRYRPAQSTTMPRGDTNLGVLCLYRCRQSGHCDQHSNITHGGKYVLYIIKCRIIKTYVQVTAPRKLNVIITWSFTPRPLEPQGLSSRAQGMQCGVGHKSRLDLKTKSTISAPAWNRTHVVYPTASCNIDWATPVPFNKLIKWVCI